MMNSNPINPEIGQPHAVSVYGSGDALDDFPVLKAFQQYIDAEQAKARKRLLTMGVFFGVLMLVVIAIFVALLVSASSRNQQLNDRLIEFAMKDRAGSAVVVQPPQDSAALLALTTKLEDLQRKLSETQARADKAVAEAEEKARRAAEASRPKEPTPEEMEIQRLKAQLSAEREKAETERKRRREEELEAYRRKHYPELYAPKPAVRPPSRPARAATRQMPESSIEQLLDDLEDLKKFDADAAAAGGAGSNTDKAADSDDGALAPISYFDDEGREAKTKTPREKPRRQPQKTPPEKEEKPARSISVKSGDMSVSWGIPE